MPIHGPIFDHGQQKQNHKTNTGLNFKKEGNRGHTHVILKRDAYAIDHLLHSYATKISAGTILPSVVQNPTWVEYQIPQRPTYYDQLNPNQRRSRALINDSFQFVPNLTHHHQHMHFLFLEIHRTTHMDNISSTFKLTQRLPPPALCTRTIRTHKAISRIWLEQVPERTGASIVKEAVTLLGQCIMCTTNILPTHRFPPFACRVIFSPFLPPTFLRT